MATFLVAGPAGPHAPSSRVVRIAATGDLHIRNPRDAGALPGFDGLHRRADLLIIAGDLTENGRLCEAECAAELLAATRLPVVAVLGNHDMRSLRRVAFRRTLERAGIAVLEGTAVTVRLPHGARVGIAGTMGCGGGFWPREGPNAVHTRTLKRLAVRAARESSALERGLTALDTDIRIAAVHFSPTVSTLGREPPAKYWMLGNGELGVVIDRCLPEVAIHGHAHLGTVKGWTPGGVPVRNVALPVVGNVYLESFEISSRLALPARVAESALLCG